MFLDVGFSVAERILYVPSVGYCLLLVLILSHLIDGSEAPKPDKPSTTLRRTAVTVAVVVIVAFAARWEGMCVPRQLTVRSTVRRNEDWRSELSIFTAAIKVAPNSSLMHYELGRASEDLVRIACVRCCERTPRRTTRSSISSCRCS